MTASAIFLSPDAQHLYFTVIRAVFIVSMVLHCISLIFLVKFTPNNLQAWRRYMLVMQVILITIDVHMELLLQPIMLFPAPAVYTTGLLCHAGVPFQIQGGIGILGMGMIGAAIIACVLHRHQSIVSAGPSRWRLSKGAHVFLIALLTAVFSLPAIIFAVLPHNIQEIYAMIRSDPRDLSWTIDRGCVLYVKRELLLNLFIGSAYACIVCASGLLVLLFVHMNHFLTRNLITPLLLLDFPATIIFTACAVDGLITFESCLVVFSLLYFHPIVHNVFWIGLTPAYRIKIASRLSCITNRFYSNVSPVRIAEGKTF